MKIDAQRDTYTLADLTEEKEIAFDLWSIEAGNKIDIASCGLSQITDEKQGEINKLLEELLPREITASKYLPTTDLIEHEIKLIYSAKPVKQRYYPVSEKLEQVMHAELEKLKEAGIVEKSRSPWNSPVVMIKKPNGTHRMCIDLKAVNAISEKDAYPTPYMDVILNKLKRAKFISTIDLKSAYHQIKLKPESRPITAFTIPGRGHWQFTRLPMGLSGAGATFQRLLEEIIGELEPYAYNYLDDIVLATETFEEHMQLLRTLILKIKNAGLTINRDKSKFCCNEVKFLGFKVNEHGLMIDPDKTVAITNYPKPKTLRQLRRFLGMSSWYRRFIKDYAKIADPLNKLTKKDVKFVWGAAQDDAFEVIKNLIANAPLLHRPDPIAEFCIQTDACDTGLGAVITQYINEQERVIAFASRALHKNELVFSTTEKECLAIKWAIEKFRPYVEGSTFTVITDHSALQWLFKKKNPVGRLGRWAQDLMAYDFKVVHRKGAHNVVPDALSRMYEDEVEIPTINAVAITQTTTDPWYKKRVYQIKKYPRRYKDWKIMNGKIYRLRTDEDINPIMDDLDEWKLVVPRENREHILNEVHNEPTAGHPGIEKTYKRAAQIYYWPGMYKTIAEYVRKCETCQKCKTDQRGKIGLMGTREIDKPWKFVSADLIGPFPTSKAGFKYVIVFEDLFSKYIICIPLKNRKAQIITKHLQNLCINFGTPEVFVSDNAKEFISETLKDFLKESAIRHELTPAYHPQSNPVERVNRDLKTKITAYIEESHKEWDKYIAQFQFAHNTDTHSTTGKTPAFLIYGREMRQPKCWKREIENDPKNANTNQINNTEKCESSSDTNDEEKRHQTRATTRKKRKDKQAGTQNASFNVSAENTNDWIERMEKIKHVHDDTLVKIEKAKEKYEKNYNKNKREEIFKEGDLIWKIDKELSNASKDISAKLNTRYDGPFKIVREIGQNMYILSKNGKPIKSTFHAKDFKRCTENIPTEDTGLSKNKEAAKKKRGRPRKNDASEMTTSSTTAAENADPSANILPSTSNDTEQQSKSAPDHTARDGQSQASTEKRSAITTPSPPQRTSRKSKSANDQSAQNIAHNTAKKKPQGR